jgi:two-component system, chemotaxis family, CheB/CheR fusion protein
MPEDETLQGRAADAGFSVVGVGASAGGLDACRKLLDGLTAPTGMAFILVQHLDPTHASMMVDLLAGNTAMTVREAADGMLIEREHLYVIPPGAYLSVESGMLRLSPPQARHGARLPFDFLLLSLAQAYGPRVVAVVLSGTGADGSAGVQAVKESGGLVIAQTPDEAGFDGMPRNVIKTGCVDLVLPAAEIAHALIRHGKGEIAVSPQNALPQSDGAVDRLAEIIALLRKRTPHDFTLYKQGTLRRRIERRMGMASPATDDMGKYLDILHRDPVELDLLAKDLLINVTNFFRDPKVFDVLAERVIPDMLARHSPDRPLRIWIAGCSSGEETYSLAMLFQERITTGAHNIKLQVFASDVDPDAVAQAREGFYAGTIAADVSPERLARFFVKEDGGYRVTPELRGLVVFTIQDVLADPPFSRLDFISCRNLLIYLRPEAQVKVLSLFHFALREGGVLLLGGAETTGAADDRFEPITKPERLYRRIGRSAVGGIGFAMGESLRTPARLGLNPAPARQPSSAELCRRLILDAYAPATVLVNRKNECVFLLGPTDRYLRVAPGSPSHDIFSMARPGLSGRLRSAIERANQEKARVVVAGARLSDEDDAPPFSIVAQPAPGDGEALLLISFIDEPRNEPGARFAAPEPEDVSRIAELERELETTRGDLVEAVRNLEISAEEQRIINEEALSVNEEYQSTNEELLTSKEELQSLNEELTALNSQLQETLERQRTSANDLQNVLYSTDVATLFLDTRLNIRLFTPAAKSLFSLIPGDVGRPLADLSSLADDGQLLTDARTVLGEPVPIEREITSQNGAWYTRRILPYRTEDGAVNGVVITFTDVTERRRVADALIAARRQAEAATAAKSRFLAAASHDLRQPLQTLTLLQGLLSKTVEGSKAKKLAGQFEETLGAMSGMLNTLLDINQIETGAIRAEIVSFPIDDMLDRLRDEFAYHPHAAGITLRVAPCSLIVRSDPRLLEQMVRNLLTNALKYTKRGKVLLGCRRRDGVLSVETWDTGIGIPKNELEAIFEEYRQLDNTARERSRGLGLGLAIVQRLSRLLDHPVRVHSEPGKGSVFAIEVALAQDPVALPATLPVAGRKTAATEVAGDREPRAGVILVVEDDPEVRNLIRLLLVEEGHQVATASDGVAALEMTVQGGVEPDLILADFNLPNGMDGLEVATTLRDRLERPIPAIILTGDTSTDTLKEIERQKGVRLHKPVNLNALSRTIQKLLPAAAAPAATDAVAKRPLTADGASVVFVVDDDDNLRAGLRQVLEDAGSTVEDFASAEAFLRAYRPERGGCLLIDAYLPGMSGMDLLHRLSEVGRGGLASIMITGNSDVPMAVQAMKAGAMDFIEKPIGNDELLAAVERAFGRVNDAGKRSAWRENAATHLASLTSRQREIMEMVLAGSPSKNIAADLGISQRTVENHRAAIMRKTGARSLPALARLALAAAVNDQEK